ncbi:MAG: ATP-dependent zinc metalloprotease FtsH [Sphingobacteriales bacterium]|jgi:AFG3 family protein|nr:ATP-dependent zinc metalloprotease FtsH [Sphingobacteriales bacterium]MBP9140649.1 ATP-dependent zinc metalloprotease FtsH [Chitinophagales bacterium]MDA0198930.1 ATP-dependent zinc metalloprotease FtsH [Bacteroidota bacterium]MBK7528417.1 ATP-dependent zinc metalloprotease FtsH [Sphingobacteriales bacterium]MBL0248191.1 ATP-dependent zinc metalloprotease FtsH [Sphingobacteriales bacterium]
MKSNNQNQNNPQNNDENNPVPESRGPRINIIAIIGVLFGVFIAQQLFFPLESSNTKEISEQEFLRKILPSHDVAKIQIVNKERVEVFIKADSLANPEYQDVRPANATRFNEKNPQYYFTIASAENFDADLRDAQRSFDPNQIINAKNVSRTNWMVEILQYLLPIFIVVAIWIFLMRRMSGGVGGAGGQIFNFGKSKATLFDGDSRVNITFNDVAGLDEAKEEVLEVVDFLRNPKKYTALGGKIPKGVLLIGPPGTGKTLLAKAVAGEAKVPFFSISGSDFVEMFVGVGASRVRDLFKQAREKAPCIIFIDEIDAIGRARGRNMIQSNDERENTLNALLVEMDGFGSEKGVIIIAATNRPDVLDSALMRPGRFDRQISVDKPDLVGREAIFKVHLLPIILADDVDVKRLAAQTPGFAGAEIANVCNEAALIAARRNKSAVEMQDFHDAIDRVIGGLEKKNKIISPEEKEIIAYHEAGHAISGWFLEHAQPLLKVSIVPRGVAALGYAQYLPKEQYLYTTEQLIDEMCMTLGGRAAEDIIFNRISTGAQNDLSRVTKLAYAMVTTFGMNSKVGNVSFYDPQQDYTFQKPYSEETSREIDEEVRGIIKRAYDRTKTLLNEKRHELETIAQQLLKKEILFKDDLERLIGHRPFEREPILAPVNVNT